MTMHNKNYMTEETKDAELTKKYGDPSTAELTWPAFTVEGGETMIFNNAGGEVRYYHDAELMELLSQLPPSGMPF